MLCGFVPMANVWKCLRVFWCGWMWLRSIEWVSLRGERCRAFGSPTFCGGCLELLDFPGSSRYLVFHQDQPQRNCKGSPCSRILFQKQFHVSFPLETTSAGFSSVILSSQTSTVCGVFWGPNQEVHTPLYRWVTFVVQDFHSSAYFFPPALYQHSVLLQIWLQLENNDF